MTRKDYITLARAMQDAHIDARENKVLQAGVWLATGRIADELSHDNPRFDRSHFIAVVRGEKQLTSRPPR